MTEFNWHEWRKKGLGSSDAPIVMGVSPWMTPYQLWEQKTNKVKKEFTGNWATERGNKLEPIARAQYEFEQGCESKAILVVNAQYPFIRSSLDGYNTVDDAVLEIKCPGKDDHAKALEGSVPEKYFPQIQHQLLTMSQAKVCHYYSFDGEKGVLVVVYRDEAYQLKLFEALCKFWNCVQTDTPPPLTDKDFKRVADDELAYMLTRYDELYSAGKQIDTELSDLKEKIFQHPKALDRRVEVNHKWRISITHRSGSIDYAKIPTLQGLDLEPYRKPGSSYRTISGVKQ